MQLIINYLYRDGGNWKKYGSAVIVLPGNPSLEEAETQLRAKCIDGMFFYHEDWGVPALFPEGFDPVRDPTWHEMEGVEEGVDP